MSVIKEFLTTWLYKLMNGKFPFTITLFEALCIIICVCSTLGILGHDLFLDASGDAGVNLTVFYNADGGKSELISLIKW